MKSSPHAPCWVEGLTVTVQTAPYFQHAASHCLLLMFGLQLLGISFSREETSVSHRAGEGRLLGCPEWCGCVHILSLLGLFGGLTNWLLICILLTGLCWARYAPRTALCLLQSSCPISAVFVSSTIGGPVGVIPCLLLSLLIQGSSGSEAQWVVTDQDWMQFKKKNVFFLSVKSLGPQQYTECIKETSVLGCEELHSAKNTSYLPSVPWTVWKTKLIRFCVITKN